MGLLLVFQSTFSQDEHHDNHSKEHHDMKGSHRLSVGMGQTHVSHGEVDGKGQWLVLPTWCIDYDYWLSNKWAIGLENEIIVESFKIESDHHEIIERTYPIDVVPIAIYKPGEHLSILGGVGYEFAKENSLFMTRLGLEYGFHLPGNWEVGTTLVWDGKWNYYNSWGLSLIVSKIWQKKH